MNKVKLTLFLLVFSIVGGVAAFSNIVSAQEEMQTTVLTSSASSSTTSATRSKSAVRQELERMKTLTSAERQQQIKELAQKTKEQRCAQVVTNITRRLNVYGEVVTNHVERYTKLATSFNTAITRFKELGLDVTTLEQKYNALLSKIQELSQLKTNVTTELEKAKSTACAEGTDFKSAVTQSASLVNQLRTKSIEIRKYIETDIRGELNKIKVAANTSKTSKSSTSTTTSISN